MKNALQRVICTSVLAVSLLSMPVQKLNAADGGRPSADGSYQVIVENGPTWLVEFSARIEEDGTTVGEVTLRDGNPEKADTEDAPFYVKALFDCLVVKGNKAIMSGEVRESSRKQYIGRRLLLVVEDNGEGQTTQKRDKLTWGVYQPTQRQWLAADAERPDDQSSRPTWIATDAERDDDAGVLSEKTETIGCESFPLSSFAFIDAKHGIGTIQVRP